MKLKTIFVCSSCGYESPKWLGKCPSCNSWNSFYEEKDVEKKGVGASAKKEKADAIQLNKVEKKTTTRIKTGIGELDRVLGGGFVLRLFNSSWWRARNWKIYANSSNL